MRTFSIAGLQLSLDYSDNYKLIEEALVATSKRYPWLDMIIVSELAVGGASRSIDYSLDNQIDNFKNYLNKNNLSVHEFFLFNFGESGKNQYELLLTYH